MANTRAPRLLFICTANVCRSPLAHAFAAGHANKMGIELSVDSASVDDVARRTHPWVLSRLAERGLGPERTKSQPLTAELVDDADFILTMTGAHAIAVAMRFRQVRTKVFTLDHFAQVVRPRADGESLDAWLDGFRRTPRAYPNQPGSVDVDDPIGTDDKTFERVAGQIDELTGRIVAAMAAPAGE